MKRSSSVPDYRKYSNGSETSLPRITKNPWLTNSSTASDYKYKRGEKFLPQNYTIMNKDKLNAIENNYYEMRYFLNDKINRLEKNQEKFNHILQYSLEQNRLQNDINAFNYDKYIDHVERVKREKDIQYYKDKNYVEKEYLINFLNEMPKIIDNKINRVLNDEYELKKQQQYMDNLKEKMMMEMKAQRMHDYMKYKRQINELKKLRSLEEQEKIRLQNEIEQQRFKYELKSLKYKNQFTPFGPFGPYPFLPFNPINNYNNPYSIGSPIDEFMKIFLFKDMVGRYQMYNKYFNRKLHDMYPYTHTNRYNSSNSDILDDYLNYRDLIKNKNTYSSYNSYYKKYGNHNKYYEDSHDVPFLNSGRAYPKKNTINKISKKRFMTSHNETNKIIKNDEKSKIPKETKSKAGKDKTSFKDKTNKDKSEDDSEKESENEKNSEDKDKNKDKNKDKDKDKDKDKKEDKKKDKKEKEEDDDEDGDLDEDDDEDSDEESNEKDKKNKKTENKNKENGQETNNNKTKTNENPTTQSQQNQQPNQTVSQPPNQTASQPPNQATIQQPNQIITQQPNQQQPQ